TPGSQNGGFRDASRGNLSDTFVGGTVGDVGGGDPVSNRTFHVTDHEITSYSGTHAQGTSPNGRRIIDLFPYHNTDNPGGVYILAVCVSGATSPRQCKYDAFHVRLGCGDGILQEGEECDDGNTVSGDGCSATCKHEVCGNHVLDPGEQCDDGNT